MTHLRQLKKLISFLFILLKFLLYYITINLSILSWLNGVLKDLIIIQILKHVLLLILYQHFLFLVIFIIQFSIFMLFVYEFDRMKGIKVVFNYIFQILHLWMFINTVKYIFILSNQLVCYKGVFKSIELLAVWFKFFMNLRSHRTLPLKQLIIMTIITHFIIIWIYVFLANLEIVIWEFI